MITFTDQQFLSWLALFGWPAVRIMAFMATDPFFSIKGAPAGIKVGFAMLITVLIAPMLPPMPAVEPVSPLGIMILLQQVVIGLTLGYVMQLVFTAIELGGHFIGLQMGLGFASFYDPQHNANTAVMSQIMNMMTVLLFLAMNGHLVVLETLIKSFTSIPVSAHPLHAIAFKTLVDDGAIIFRYGLMLSIPVVATLLITNLSIGVMSRAAPQLNVFAVGFPLTLGMGGAALYFSLPSMVPIIHGLFDLGTRLAIIVVRSLAGT